MPGAYTGSCVVMWAVPYSCVLASNLLSAHPCLYRTVGCVCLLDTSVPAGEFFHALQQTVDAHASCIDVKFLRAEGLALVEMAQYHLLYIVKVLAANP